MATDADVNGDRSGVVPPEFVGHPFEESEGFDETVEHGFGAFGGQGDGEGSVGVAPSGDEDGNEFSSFGEVDVDVSEVGFAAMAGEVIEWDEGFALIEFLLLEVSSDLIVAASVLVFIDESSEDLLSGVALFSRGVFVGEEDGVDDGLEGPEDGGVSGFGGCVGGRLGGVEGFANGVASDAELFGDLSCAESVAVELTDFGEVVQGSHPCIPVRGSIPAANGDRCTLDQFWMPMWT